MTDTDVTFLPNYNDMDLVCCPFIRHDPHVPSAPVSLQALDRVGCAMAFSVTLPDSRVSSPRTITFPTLSVSLDTKN